MSSILELLESTLIESMSTDDGADSGNTFLLFLAFGYKNAFLYEVFSFAV